MGYLLADGTVSLDPGTTLLHRLVQAAGAYPARPASGYVDFLGELDPGALLLPGDTWTQLPHTLTPPLAPTIGAATGGTAQASVAFTPAATGPAATGFTATATPGGATATGPASPLVVAGLTNGASYTFTAHATNADGNSPESAPSNSVTPTAPPPPPSGVTDDFTGTNGAAWNPAVWGPAPGGIFTNDIQSNKGRALFTSAGSYEEFTRHFALADAANWRVRWCMGVPPVTAGWSNIAYLQATSWPAGLNTPSSCYSVTTNSGGFSIAKRVAGAATSLVGFTSLPATNRWFDVKVVAGVLSYKAWNGLVTDAPAAYTTVPNPTPLTGTGGAGLYFAAGSAAGTMDFRIDDVLVDNNPA